MVCTPVCVIEHIIMIGDIMTKIWDSPMRKVLEDLLKPHKLDEFILVQ